MRRVTIGGIVKTSIVTAFTIAAALIWKDVIVKAINTFFPQDVLLYEFIVAIISTIFVIIAIYIVLKTESEAHHLLNELRNMNMKRRKEIIKKIKKEEIELKKETQK